MPLTPYLIETGSGVDLHGRNDTTAAKRAVEDAIRRNSLLFLRALNLPSLDKMHVDVTIATPNPAALDVEAVRGLLPYGVVSVRAVPGGMLAETGLGGDPVLVANAAVLVSLET